MRVSEHYHLGLRQPQLDFVDVAIDTDSRVFIDPRALLLLETPWGRDCVALVQDFFRTVLNAIKAGDQARAASLLGQLHEPNETRLGLSRGRPQGHALGDELAGRVRQALTESEAVQSGLLTDLEDTILMIEGIGDDLVSDITTNVIREPLVRYTQHAAEDLGIPMEEAVYPGGPFWDPGVETWYQALVPLPVPAAGRPLVLVPKVIVRKRMDYDADEYFSGYIIPLLREIEIDARSSLVHTLKTTGEPRVTKKDLVAKYGRGKKVNEKVTRDHPQLLDSYRRAKSHVRPPMSHSDIAETLGTDVPDWGALLERVLRIAPGKKTATDYHRAVEALLAPLFYPALTMPERETKIHAGRKRIDITFANAASTGFFDWLRKNYDAAHVIVECKNYEGDPANPELDQVSGRFSPNRGRFGLLVCRTFADKALFIARCRDTANDGRGFIIALDDEDLRRLLETRKSGDPQAALPYLRERFTELVM